MPQPQPKPMMSSRLLQLPQAASNSNSSCCCSAKSRRKPHLLPFPSCSVVDCSSSPLSMISQASTSCALLSSASSLDGCSQPQTPNIGLLDLEAAFPLPLAASPQPQSPAAAPAAAAAAADTACDARHDASRNHIRMRGRCKYEAPGYGEQAAQVVPQGGESAAAASAAAVAAAAAKGPGEAAAGPKAVLQLASAEAAPPEGAPAVSFLSSPTAAASPVPLRLPIPARGLRRLQHPRLQQQAAAAAAEESDALSSSHLPRSLRRLQLPRLRPPRSAENLSAPHSSSGGAAKTDKRMSPREIGTGCICSSKEDFSSLSHAEGGGCLSCRGECKHEPPGGALGDAFEAAAHAAHVAAHVAARAAAQAAAHAAVLKRRAAEAYWCSHGLFVEPVFSVYPDLERDIHVDYDMYCAHWPEGEAAPPLSSGSPQEQTDSMRVDGPTDGGSSPCTNSSSSSSSRSSKGHHGHLVLGEGRYGKVVLAENRRTKEAVAVKMLDKRRVLTDGTWDCRQELEVHSRLPRHPHVVSVLDVYEDRKSLYILMELCDRNTLVDRIVSDGPFTEEQAKLLFAQLLSGVMHCHNHNIVHRDLKPENILFARQGPRSSSSSSSYRFPLASHDPAVPTVKITDFGSACYAVPGELNGTACGTIHYLAPEVLAGNYYDGFASDVWSLGVILYIMISACPPFFGESDGEVVQRIVAGSYSMSGYQWRYVSDKCKDIVRRLLTADPRRRISLNEAMSHPWFCSADAAELSLPVVSCVHCCGEASTSYDEDANEEALEEDFEDPCCCGNCHGDRSNAPSLVLSPHCHFPSCAPTPRSTSWASAHARGFIDWPCN